MPEANFKRSGLAALAEEISREPNTDSGPWLLEVTLMQIYNKKERDAQGKVQSLGRKGASRNVVESSPVLKRTEQRLQKSQC